MGENYKRLLKLFTLFGFLVFAFSVWEFFRGVYPKQQALIFSSSSITRYFVDLCT